MLIASRNQHHAAQSLAALRAGKHVFVEKPMALTAEECRELCAAVEETGKQLTVGFNRRFAPFYRELKRESGAAQLARRGAMPHQFAGDFGQLLDGRPRNRRRDPG